MPGLICYELLHMRAKHVDQWRIYDLTGAYDLVGETMISRGAYDLKGSLVTHATS